MGEIVHFPNNKKDKNNDMDVIQVSKNKITVDGVIFILFIVRKVY